MRENYENQLAQLNQNLTQMGELCEQIIDYSSRLLVSWDKDLAKQVKKVGGEIDEMERSIETVCMRLLLRQQPVARDLRVVSAGLKIITDLERIGDQAEDIAEIAESIQGENPEGYGDIQLMAQHAASMVTDSVDAYIRQDVELAKNVLTFDDQVDGDFRRIRKELIQAIAREPEQGEKTLDLLMIAKYFERIADHATNVAEWVIYSVTGTHEEA